jgi:hypothetical protein
VIPTHSQQLRLQHLTCIKTAAIAIPHSEQQADELHRAALQVIDQPDPQTAGLNPTAVRLQLHLPLRNRGYGIAKFPPNVCVAAFFYLRNVRCHCTLCCRHLSAHLLSPP